MSVCVAYSLWRTLDLMYLSHVWKTMNGFRTSFFLPPLCLSLSSFISLFFLFHRCLLFFAVLFHAPFFPDHLQTSRRERLQVAMTLSVWGLLWQQACVGFICQSATNTQEHTRLKKTVKQGYIKQIRISKMQKANRKTSFGFLSVKRCAHAQTA